MSFFSKILDKLGLGKDKDKTTPSAAVAAKPAVPAAKPAAPATAGTGVKPKTFMEKKERDSAIGKVETVKTVEPAKAAPTPVSEVDVVNKLEGLAAGSGLDWKVSIVDLLKLLDIDSSREARNELAKELGCPPELMSDSAKMNVWLHKTVLKKIAENGGNIPQSLLD
jgi:hypothetical protein